MAYSDNISRLSRLTSILLKLQSKPLVSVKGLADQFKVSKRTIYRDLQALDILGVETEGYQRFVAEGSIKKVKAMRSKRK